MLKTKILHNPSAKDIPNYRIEEAELDQNDEPIFDNTTGRLKWTGNTMEWSLRAGETAEFPAYVADYLKSIYNFLEERGKPETEKEKKEVKTAEARAKGEFVCPICNRSFLRANHLGLHLSKHPDYLRNL